MKKVRNRYLESVASLVGETDYIRAAASFVGRFREVGCSLQGMAYRLGVSKILEEELPFDGGVFQGTDGRVVIKLNSSSLPTRKRFTLAHEISHLMLASAMSLKFSCSSDRNLERACDLLASELLMPQEEVAQVVRQMGSSSPDGLRSLARRFDVSLHSAAVRIHQDLKLWKRRIGLWKWESGPRQLWFVGKRPWATDRPSFAAFEAAKESTQPVRTMDSFRRGEVTAPVSLELLNIGADCILGLVGTIS